MGHDPAELETRLARCERAIFGDDDSSQGLSARVHMIEVTATKIETTLSRINWMLITAIVLALLNVLIPRGALPSSHQSTSVITSEAASSADTTQAIEAEELAQTRGYYLTADIARKWGKSPKTITDWIASRRFIPAPTQHGREYHFPLDTIEATPATAANSATPPLSAANRRDPTPQ